MPTTQSKLLEQLTASRLRIGISPAELRQLAFEVIQGVSWPVRSHADLDCDDLQRLLDVMEALEQLLTAFANSTLTPAQAQTLVDGMNADDADAKSITTAIQAALPTPPAMS